MTREWARGGYRCNDCGWVSARPCPACWPAIGEGVRVAAEAAVADGAAVTLGWRNLYVTQAERALSDGARLALALAGFEASANEQPEWFVRVRRGATVL